MSTCRRAGLYVGRVQRTRHQASNCTIAATLQILGEKWTLLIIRESFYGATRFEQFQSVLACSRTCCPSG
jgi:DNA-binding HxlR family transcriptional regulator